MRRVVLALTVFGAALTLLAGCGTKGTLKPNVPPDTRIFVQGPVDTVNHNVHLYWFGTDVDGFITGYEIRFLNPNALADTCWTYVPADSTNGVFSVYTPEGFATPVFEVRAIDNSGEQPPARTPACQPLPPDTLPHYGTRDPSPARQVFKFKNLPPTVTLLYRPHMADTTYGSITLSWAASDPDGDGTKLRYFIWLDGNEGHKNLVAGNSFTIPTEQFLQNGVLRTLPRQVCIQAIDDGGMLSRVDSTHWMVRSPGTGGRKPNTGRLLLIDDQPSGYSLNFKTDTLYYNTAARNLLPEQYSILQMEYTNPFRSLADVIQTFQQFDAVVWYIGGPNGPVTFETTLQTYQDAIGPYLESGGKLYLEGLDLIDEPHGRGPLRADFVTDYLGSDFLFQYFHATLQDSTACWTNRNQGKFVTAWGDTLLFTKILPTAAGGTGGMRCFGVRDDSYGLVWAPPSPTRSLDPPGVLPFSVPVAVSVPRVNVPPIPDGRFVLVTFPLEVASSPVSPVIYRNAPKFLAQVFQQMGLTTP
jgi:predicted small lipoprotein YifL